MRTGVQALPKVRTMSAKDLPIGCRVVPRTKEHANRMGVPFGGSVVGTVIHHDPCGLLVVVWWDDRERPGYWDQWVPERFQRIDEPTAKKLDLDVPKQELKRLNTDGRADCAHCGKPLKDPRMGPTYRHCPTCEP